MIRRCAFCEKIMWGKAYGHFKVEGVDEHGQPYTLDRPICKDCYESVENVYAFQQDAKKD